MSAAPSKRSSSREGGASAKSGRRGGGVSAKSGSRERASSAKSGSREGGASERAQQASTSDARASRPRARARVKQLARRAPAAPSNEPREAPLAAGPALASRALLDAWHPAEVRVRKVLVAGGAALVVGVALVGLGPSNVGAALTLGALVTMLYGIHTFGRLGPVGEEPTPRGGARGVAPARPSARRASRDG